jgi:nicotinate-nucleotide adenylyltransferase
VRVGVLGGTFDPIHYAHLIIAEETRIRLQLERVLFVPSGQPPHKLTKVITPAIHRLAMLQLAIASNPHFELSRLDMDRCGPCYSVDLLEILQSQFKPGAQLYFIIGLDSLAELPTWHEPARLIRLCRLAVVQRPGYHVDMVQLETILPGVAGRLDFVEAPEMGISSSEIQRRVRAGLPIKYQLPEPVEAYIVEHGLYRAGS